MPIFRVTRKSDRNLVYEYAAPQSVEWVDFPYADFEHSEVTEPAPEPVTVFGGRRTLTKQEFYDLLGTEARKAILTMAKQSVEIEDWLKRFEILTPYLENYSVDLDYADTAAGVLALEPILISLGVVQAGWAEGVLRG